MVIGSRFVEGGSGRTSWMRRAGILFFRIMLRPILGKPVQRSHFGVRGREPRSARRVQPKLSAGVSGDRSAGGAATPGVPVSGSAVQNAAAARGAQSSITPVKSVYYIVHVLLGVLVNILKFERHRWSVVMDQMERLLNVTTLLSASLISLVLILAAPRAYSRRVLGELAAAAGWWCWCCRVGRGRWFGWAHGSESAIRRRS